MFPMKCNRQYIHRCLCCTCLTALNKPILCVCAWVCVCVCGMHVSICICVLVRVCVGPVLKRSPVGRVSCVCPA